MTHESQQKSFINRRWLVLLILCLPVFIGSLDLTIVSAILPEVINQLNLPVSSSLDDASWMVSAYLLSYTISMIFMGRISDMIGRRGIYIACLMIFISGSWFVSIAHTWPTELYLDVYRTLYPNPDTHIPPSPEMRELYMIILGRTIQAFGAGAIVPVTMAVVSDLFPPNKRARPLGLVGAIDTSGWVLGHLYGGVMVKFFGEFGTDIVDLFASVGISINTPTWRTLFILNIPFSIIALLGALIALRGKGEDQALRWQRLPIRLVLMFRDIVRFIFHNAGRFDMLGATLISISLITLSVGINALSPSSAFGEVDVTAGAEGPASYMFPMLIASGLAFIGFIFWELRTRTPLIDLRLFLRRNYSASGFTNFCVGFTLALALVSVPLVINLRADVSDSEAFETAALLAGLVLSGLTVPMALAAVPGGWLSDRFGYRDVTVGGMALATFGFVLCSLTWTTDISEWIMAAEMIIVGVGLGLTISPVSTALINEATQNERGVSAALVLILRLIGMTLAIPGMTAYALYRVEQRISALGDFSTVEARQDAYLDATVAQINELFLIGAAISFLALLVALNLRGGQAQAMPNSEAKRVQESSNLSAPAKV